MNYEELVEALNKFYGNTALSRAQTREGLEGLRDEINTRLVALDEDEAAANRNGAR